MALDRRHLIGCVVASVAGGVRPATAQPARSPYAVLLAPLTGPYASIGRSMERAGRLVAPAAQSGGLVVVDTAVAGAAAAAQQALGQGARILLGPLTAADLGSVVAVAAGRARVIAFTNDDEAPSVGASSIFGLTASQTTSAILAYARGRGVRRIGVVSGSDRMGVQVLAAAQAFVARSQMQIAVPTPGGGLGEAAWSGGLPDAVLFADASPAGANAAGALRAGGVQLLGLPALAATGSDNLTPFEGAWLCAPDPSSMAAFDRRYDSNGAEPPGLLAALAFDAAGVARAVAGGAALDRSSGFTGAVGSVRFDGTSCCARQLAILAVREGRLRVVDRRWGG